MPHLFLAVTAHGYGHLAQSSPVVDALASRLPGLRVTLQSDIDPGFARRRLPPGFTHLQTSADPGLLMDGPLVTRWAESLAAYCRFDDDYDRHLRRQMETLRDLAPDLVLADVPWPTGRNRIRSICWYRNCAGVAATTPSTSRITDSACSTCWVPWT